MSFGCCYLIYVCTIGLILYGFLLLNLLMFTRPNVVWLLLFDQLMFAQPNLVFVVVVVLYFNRTFCIAFHHDISAVHKDKLKSVLFVCVCVCVCV